MTEAFIKKNVKLSLELDTYLAHHPDLLDKIPNGAYVIITVSNDSRFNNDSISIVGNLKRKRIVEAHKTLRRWDIRPYTSPNSVSSKARTPAKSAL